MPRFAPGSTGFRSRLAWLPVLAVIFSPPGPLSPFPATAVAVPPRGERVANRVAERRYARMSIAEARAARAEALVAEIAPLVPEPPVPRPATVRRMLRAGVPLGSPPAIATTPPRPPAQAGAVTRRGPPAPAPAPDAARRATAAAPSPADPHAFTLDPDPAAAPATADVAPDGTRSVLATGGDRPTTRVAVPGGDAPPGPAVTQPPVELLPTPEAR